MPVAGGPKITTTGILLEVDAANASSYISGSSTWVNVFNPGTRNGTINGTLGFNQDDSKGTLTFPGTASSYVDFGNIGNLSVSWSFQVAVKPAPSASGNYTILSYASGSNTGSWTYKLDYSSSNQSAVLSVYSATGSARVVHQVTGSVPTGSWSIINASYGNTVIGMYVNGAPTDYVVTTGSTAGYNANNRLYLGGTFGATSSFYTGSMASFFSYNTDVPNTQLVQNYNAYATRFGLPPSVLFPGSSDPDAFRFIEIAGLTDQTQITAVNNLVTGLKGYNLWNKMHAIYPFAGGTAFSNKWNLKDPRDLDIAYRLIFSGAWTFTSLGSGGGGNALTNWRPNTASLNPATSLHASIYTTVTSSGGANPGLGSTAGFLNNSFEIFPNYNNGNGLFYNPGEPTTTQTPAGTFPSNALGLFAMTRTAASSSAGYARGGVTINSTSTKGYNPATGNSPISLNATSGWNGTYRFGFATLGEALTQTDVDNLYTLVQAFNVTLGRNPN
jgi:hypothetical protein